MSATSFAYVRYAPHHQVENIAENYAGTLLTQVLRAFVPFKCFSLDSDLKKNTLKKIPRSILELHTEFSLWAAQYLCMKLPTYLSIHLSILLRNLCAGNILD